MSLSICTSQRRGGNLTAWLLQFVRGWAGSMPIKVGVVACKGRRWVTGR